MLKKYFVIVLGLLIIGSSSVFAADWHGHGRGDRHSRWDRQHRHHQQRVIHRLPRGAVLVYRDHVPHYFHNHVYYVRAPRGYAVCG